jgi:AraC family transcriptional regulator
MDQHLGSGCFLGEVLVRRQFGGIVLTETRHHQRDWLPLHSHQNAYFCLVRRGQFAERFGHEERLCVPMTLTFHPPQERHSEQIQSTAASSFNIELEPSWLLRLQTYAPAPLEPCAMQGGPLTNIMLRLQQEFEQNDAVSPLAVEGLSLELLAGLVRVRRDTKSIPSWLTTVRTLLRDRFVEALDLTSLAQEAGVHPVYLVQCFRRHYDCTPGDYQRQLRVEAAKQKLIASSHALAEIALQVGFADQSHLTRVFKQYTGQTPAAFRRSARVCCPS